MAVDAAAAGRVYPAQRYEVSREKIREFADAIGDPNPAYRDVAAATGLGHPDLVAPPTFAAIPLFRGLDVLLADLNIEYAQLIHTSQRFVYAAPIGAGDVLVATTSIDSIRSRAGTDVVGVTCEVVADSGEPRCTATATVLVGERRAND